MALDLLLFTQRVQAKEKANAFTKKITIVNHVNFPTGFELRILITYYVMYVSHLIKVKLNRSLWMVVWRRGWYPLFSDHLGHYPQRSVLQGSLATYSLLITPLKHDQPSHLNTPQSIFALHPLDNKDLPDLNYKPKRSRRQGKMGIPISQNERGGRGFKTWI